jgi:threonine dehydrogenase-like Zn-dependent dehydrogenase
MATHVMSLDQAAEGYRKFKEKEDGCVRTVFEPAG